MKILLAGFVCVFAAIAAPPATTGTVKGSVRDSTGKLVPGRVRVFLSQALAAGAIRHTAPPVQTGPQVTARYVDSEGNFSAENLAPGAYIACASAATPGYLDPCQWAATASGFTIAAGQIVNDVKIVLAQGAVIPIRVHDSDQKMLKHQEGAVDGEFQIHVVTGTGHHHNAVIVGQDDKGRDHAVTVPFGTPLSVQIFSPRLTVSESSGKLSTPGGLSFTVPAATTPAPLIFTVTGGK